MNRPGLGDGITVSVLVLALLFLASTFEARATSFSTTCAMPKGSYQRSGSTYDFTLKNGDVGGCPTDGKARHGAPYWERAELRSANLRSGRTYDITFEVNFDPKTSSSSRTSFFQIHTYNNACKECAPALMLRVHGGRVIASVFGKGARSVEKSLGVGRSGISGRWAKFRVLATTNTGQMNKVEVWIDGKKRLTSQSMYIAPKGRPYLKIGLYRPGNRSGLPVDRMSIRRIDAR